jgi:peptidoglycan/LPS O-acetylase OafA/YrhL
MSVSLRYRPDIDGLRAVAVLGVIIYHAFPKWLPGGFSGVDIFFVISGYLISGILYKGHREESFSFKEFYARRIRRLFPALIVMLLMCLGYGWFVLLPDEYSQMGKHVAAGTLFIQNIVFWKESGYFDIAANLKPMLHLWSLAVEEQFYIVFPLVLIVLWKRPKMLVPAMVVLMVTSFAGNVVMSHQNSSTDFFLTPYRGWEFLGGSLLAWWHFDKGHEEDAPKYREALSCAGLILLALGMGLLVKDQPYPGWRALLPVAGTLLLMDGGRGAWVNRKILSHPAMVWLGLISYPLYLFHWPALSFVHIIKGGNPSAGIIWGALGVAFLLTVLTYYFVERKLRHNKSILMLILQMTAFMTISGLGLLVWSGILASKKSDAINKINKAIKDRKFMNGFQMIKWDGPLCLGRIGGEGKQTLFFGDSNMQQYTSRIIKILNSNAGAERGAIFVTCAGTPPITGLSGSKYYEEFIKTFQATVYNDKRVDRIVIAALWILYFESESAFRLDSLKLNQEPGVSKALEYFGNEINRLVFQEHKKVTIVLNIPAGEDLDPKKQINRGLFSLKINSMPELSVEEFLNGRGKINEKIKNIALANGAEIVDPVHFLSMNGICIYENEEGPIRCGGTHLRPKFVRDNVKYLDESIAP